MRKKLFIMLILVMVGFTTGCGNTVGYNMAGNLEDTRINKEKSSIDEIIHLIHMEFSMLEPEEYEYLLPNENGAAVNENGEIYIVDLFDTSNEIGQMVVENITESYASDKITFFSQMKEDCIVKIVKLDVANKEVIIQISSEEADLEFYMDIDNEYEGVYQGE